MSERYEATTTIEHGVPAGDPIAQPSPAGRPVASGRVAAPLRTLAVGLLVGALIGTTATAGLLRFSAPAGAPSPAEASADAGRTAAARPPSAAEETAIRGVIQRANDAQVAAIARHDPGPMRDTATPSHYDELVRVNADLAASGVVAVKLARIEWGPITVTGSTATAVTWETWRSTLADGTTQQSRDENRYTLVAQGGVWVVESDDQPGGADRSSVGSGAAPGAADAPGAVSPLAVVPSRSTSSNWSGYAATGGTYTAVTGTWIVPEPSAHSAGADATWVGIGGVTSRDLIQAGTEATVPGDGTVQYQAWIEMLPQSSQPVPLAVAPGDSVTVTISAQTADTWRIVIRNNSSAKSYDTTVRYASSRSSAEWVEEAPSGGRRLLPIDAFGRVTFTNARATKDGASVTVVGAGGTPITMTSAQRQALAVPSALGPDGASFTVTRTAVSAGATGVAPGGAATPGAGAGTGRRRTG